MAEWVLKSRRVLVSGSLVDAAVIVRGERIDHVITDLQRLPRGLTVEDVGDAAVLPGLVDCHAHLNEPGRTDWEGFATGTRAASAGGITTLIDMPLNSIPATTSLSALESKAKAAQAACAVDYGFWGGVVPGNARELEPLVKAGVVGFKCFLCPSGVDEFPHVTRRDLEEAMPLLARLGVPLIVHAELEDTAVPPWNENRKYQSYLSSRPRRFENHAIEMMVELCRKTPCRVHIVHLSSSDAIPALRRARAEGLPISAETCPHYLTFCAEEIPDGSTAFKCAPPIREAENRERLWQGLKDGDISMVVSDHSPCTPHLKRLESGDFHAAWGGIASLQLGLSSVWTGAHARSIRLEQMSRWMSEATAQLVGLDHRKGRIAPGYDADLVVFDPDPSWTVEASQLLQRHPITPYAGRRLMGRIERTYLRGSCIYKRGSSPKQPPRGQRLHRQATQA